MARVPRDLINICRFCLCQNENELRPIEEIVPLTVKDVERFTGIKINMTESASYAICFDCTQKLKISADFRQSCLNNNPNFEELLRVLITSTKSDPRKIVPPLTHQERDPLDLHFVINDDGDDDGNEEIVEILDDDEDEDDDDVNDANSHHQKTWNDQVENYSANYIDPGEYAESDEHESGYEYSTFPSYSVNEESEGRAQPTTSNTPDNEPQVREIVTQRTRKSYSTQQLCSLCGKLVTNYTYHLNLHKNDRKYACPHCPWKMTCNGNLTKHIKSVHLKVMVKTCSICDRGFTSNHSYVSHMVALHGIGEKIPCTLCPRMFNQKSGLTSHMRRAHSNVRNLACDICGAAFKVRRALRNHMSVHSTDQPYQCGKCPKRFKSSYARKIHEQTHSGIMFDCALCGRKYRYKSLLNMHIRKMHPEEDQEPAGCSKNNE